VVVEEEEDVWVWVSEVQERGRVGGRVVLRRQRGVYSSPDVSFQC
jgi:hypothetical protein